MKHVVIYKLGNNNSALSFDSRNDAIDYINESSTNAGDNMRSMESLNPSLHRMKLANGKEINIEIKEYPDSKVRYDLIYEKNGRHVETRRFTKRKLAVDFANKILDDLDCYADEFEDDAGEWSVNAPERSLKAHLIINLVILGDKETTDYDILGIKSTSTSDDVKKAYRKLAIQNHPDRGGDPKKFQKIHDAYERIMNGSSKTEKQKIAERFGCMDMREFFKNFNHFAAQAKADLERELGPIYDEIRGKAATMIIVGILMMLAGAIFTGVSYNSASAGGTYTIFSGLLVWGGWTFIKGVYYAINPKAFLKKLK